MSYFQEIDLIKNSSIVDSFGRVVVANPFTIFDCAYTKDKAPKLYDESVGLNTTSTHSANRASVTLATTGAGAGTTTRQTFRPFAYQKGKSQLVLLTRIFNTGVTSVTKRTGQYDENNGFMIQQSGTTFQFGYRSSVTGSPVDTFVSQSSFNVDKMDGTGISGLALDLTKFNIFYIRYGWLGGDDPELGVVIGRVLYPMHRIPAANVLTSVVTSTPNLPLRDEIIASASNPSTTFECICQSVISEGGVEETGLPFTISRVTALTTLNDADYYPLIAIRLKSTHQDVTLNLESLSLVCSSTAVYAYKFILNPTVTGTAFSYTGLTDSALEYDIARTSGTKVSGGYELFSVTSQAATTGAENIKIPERVKLGASIANTSDVLVLAIARLTGTTESFYGTLNWTESY